MFKQIALLALVGSTLAAPGPTEPFGESVFNEGGECTIAWDADPTGEWTTMNIQLMTGSNLAMVHITTVATVDATEETSFTYPCPAVEPNSQIYFYQFTSPASDEVLWTTRFTIADAEGNTVPPPDTEETADGETVGWGVGELEDPSLAVPPPSDDAVESSSRSATRSTPSNTRSTPTPTNTRSSSTRSPSASSSADQQGEDSAASSLRASSSLIAGVVGVAVAALL